MRRHVRTAAAAACCMLACALLASAGTASAADTPPSADLDRAVRLWLGEPAAGAELFSATPEGDHLSLTVPLAALVLPGIAADDDAGPVTATARKLADGRWSIAMAALPEFLGLTRAASGKTSEIRLGLHVAAQSATAVIDPAMRLPSQFASSASQIMSIHDGGRTFKTLNIAEQHNAVSWQPQGEAGTDVEYIQQIAGVRLHSTGMAWSQTYTVSMLSAEGSDTMRVPNAVRAMPALRLSPSLAAATTDRLSDPGVQFEKGTMLPRDPEQRIVMRAAVNDMFDSIGPGHGDWTGHELRFDGSGIAMETHFVHAAYGLGAPDGIIDLRASLSLDGIRYAFLVADRIRDALLPRSVVAIVHVSGLPAEPTADLIRRWLLSGGKGARDVARDLPVLLDKGPLVIALNDLKFVAGPALVAAQGSLRVIRPTLFEGDATISMDGVRAYLDRARADPKLRALVLALTYWRGLGESAGPDNMTWKVTFAGGHVVVNGLDAWPLPAR